MNRILITGLVALATLAGPDLCAADHPIDSEELEGLYLRGGDQVEAFRTVGTGWSSTSLGTSSLGAPASATWSVVPDGTSLPTGLGEPSSPNNLVSFLDGIHHGGASPGGTDLMQRDWWHLMNSAFDRWDELSGISFDYESNDDGVRLGSFLGSTDVRGDHRIGGHSIDGQISPTFLAYNFFPNNSDTVIDTDELNRWGNTTNNYLLFRNMMMHEIGHGIGLNHVESFDVFPSSASFQFGTFLMEPTLASAFDGPQFDDILGAHRLYGDNNEEGLGNDTHDNATLLGALHHVNPLKIGADANDLSVDTPETDFVSIDDDSDIDFFHFTMPGSGNVSIRLTPLGPTYDEGPQGSGNGGTQRPFVSAARNDLTLTLNEWTSSGLDTLAFANDGGLGFTEEILQFELLSAGDFLVQVGGLSNNAQFFQLDVWLVPEPSASVLTLLSIALGSTLRPSRRLSLP